MFKKTIGAAGITYLSETEAAISFKLLEHSIVSHDAYYPQTFHDGEAEPFRAKSDFQCRYTGIDFEFKSGFMNGLKTKSFADKAMVRLNTSVAEGRILPKAYNYKLLRASWSDSVQKFKAVQYQRAESGHCVVLVFDAKPDLKTIGRLDRAKVFWCIYADEHFRQLMSFRILAKHGIRAQYDIKGHLFESYGGLAH